jgi:hypothetical protein
MCDQCIELDKKIEHYRSLMARITDPLTNQGLEKRIEEMLEQKSALLPERQK